MAFDDFESADADPSVPQGLDVDLFDFPLVDPFGVAKPRNASQNTAQLATKSVTSGANSSAEGDDLFAAPNSSASGSLESFEADVDRISERVADLIEGDDLDAYLDEPLIDDDFDAAFESPTGSPATEAGFKRKRKSKAQAASAAQRKAPVAPTAPIVAAAPVAASGPFQLSRVGMILGGVAAIFAFALLGVVWSAGRGMQAALASRNENVADSQLQSRINELEQLMNAQRQELLGALQSKDDQVSEMLPTNVHVEPEWLVERKLIQAALNEGRFREARKRLFALQATMDDLNAEIREELEPTVAFLIPETYRLQAQAEGGEQ